MRRHHVSPAYASPQPLPRHHHCHGLGFRVSSASRSSSHQHHRKSSHLHHHSHQDLNHHRHDLLQLSSAPASPFARSIAILIALSHHTAYTHCNSRTKLARLEHHILTDLAPHHRGSPRNQASTCQERALEGPDRGAVWLIIKSPTQNRFREIRQ